MVRFIAFNTFKKLKFLLFVLISIIAITAKSIPVITLSPISPQLIYSTGNDTFQYHVSTSNITPNTNVIIYQSTDSTFNPYNNQGDSIGFIPFSAIPNDFNFSSCVKTIGIFINACGAPGSEQRNEYMVLTSGAGIRVNNLAVDFSSQNNSGNRNHDINMGINPCGYTTPSTTLISALQTGSCNPSNVIAASPTDSIPPNAIILLFTSDSVSNSYNINGLCNYGYPIYVIQNACTRTSGAFTNLSNCTIGNRYRTTTVINNSQGCSDNFTFDLCGISNTAGEYAIRQQGIDTATVNNNGIIRDINCLGLQYAPQNFTFDTILKYPIPLSFCDSGFNFVKAITDPFGTQTISNSIKYKLICAPQCAYIDTFNCQTLTFTLDSARFCVPIKLPLDSASFTTNGFHFCMTYDTNFVRPTSVYNRPFNTNDFTVTIDSMFAGKICVTISNVQHITFTTTHEIDLGCMQFVLNIEQFTYYANTTRHFDYLSFHIVDGCNETQSQTINAWLTEDLDYWETEDGKYWKLEQ